MMNYRNARRTDSEAIDCEIDHPVYGWTPFTCHPLDTGADFDVSELYARIDSDPATAPYIPPTQAELDAAASKLVRKQRDRVLSLVVDPLVSNPLRWGDLTYDQQKSWSDYRRVLLDLPQQVGFPHNVIWPTAPNEVD